MFDFGFSELLLIGVIALVVLGPERLPKAARMAGSLLGRVQRTVSSVKQELSAQIEMDELRKAKSEFESAAESLRNGLGSTGESLRKDLDDISDGLKVPAWERVPQQRTPADFGLDEHGNPLGSDHADNGRLDYPMPSENPHASGGFHTVSLRRQAMQRKRDMRPRHRPKPQLRVRKK
ncbi:MULTISPECIES: Sec-independent protein translocase protein TatB [unclassified Neisseria]|uniref:Sec-independent protein translocase protein TatB n=1 Tax=unclassified Neisseria TaxID=2623750 RepID=UPI002664FDC7|nr:MULTISPECIES: Sec-independent protein translocase protein TatB [unclassified Neisseria]MDO1510631.1 Sec-independent protein translocase protein TatB [Neisseria sp. MVDL19-042950]MDO1516245.1 Sec-independent protein translocase protein TatB [Neisseria sp. MVDL18-041461]MDO1564283.1 Sec-independent protein translocase protein TatB [Neisseria sp. MVDL20-010259]